MKSSRSFLYCVAIACALLLAAALYLQASRETAPCPLCIVQHYLLAALALTSTASAGLPRRFHKAGACLSLCISLAGVGAALRHLWLQARPESFCDAGALGETLNAMPTAELLPLLFKTDGLCLAPSPLMGLSLPQWSLLCFVVITLGLLRYIVQREPLVPWLR